MSTVAEQIAGLKSGIKRLRTGATPGEELDCICDALATLEGMAAPESEQ